MYYWSVDDAPHYLLNQSQSQRVGWKEGRRIPPLLPSSSKAKKKYSLEAEPEPFLHSPGTHCVAVHGVAFTISTAQSLSCIVRLHILSNPCHSPLYLSCYSRIFHITGCKIVASQHIRRSLGSTPLALLLLSQFLARVCARIA